jgi:FHA domain-containing protein
MPRLVVHPGTPQAWEIQLKPGLNFLGRGSSNDFKIEDLSVSTSHCQIRIDNGSAVITDMGSTNGTYIKGAKILEFPLQSGQQLRLGSVDMIFYTDGPDAVNAVLVPASQIQTPPLPPRIQPAVPPPPPPPPAMRPVSGLKLSGLAHAAEPPAVVTATDAPPVPPPLNPKETAGITGTRFCKFHPKVPARYLCNKCNRTFCELCVNARAVGTETTKMCRSCGVECVPVHFQRAAPKSFSSALAGAFGYPFQGAGIIILVFATIAFAAMDFLLKFGILGWFIAVSFYGFLFLFMQNIIHTTTSDEEEPISFPDVSSLAGAAFQLSMTILASFWLFLALIIAKFFDYSIPGEAIIASVIVGGVYFPMAFLAVAMKDSVAAANPLVVIPAMMKVPGQYAITVVLLLIVFAIRKGGALLSGVAGHEMIHTKNISMFLMAMSIKTVLGLISVYLLTVTMRILGLFYNASKDKLGWFSH